MRCLATTLVSGFFASSTRLSRATSTSSTVIHKTIHKGYFSACGIRAGGTTPLKRQSLLTRLRQDRPQEESSGAGQDPGLALFWSRGVPPRKRANGDSGGSVCFD